MDITAKKIKLSKLAKIFAGHPFRAQIKQKQALETAVVRARDISEFSVIDWDALVRTEVRGRETPNWLAVNDILLISRGASFRACRVDEGIKATKVVADPNFFVLRLTSTEIRSDYLVWWLNQLPVQSFFQQQAQGTTGLKSIGRRTLENTPIIFPPLKKQKQIAEFVQVQQAEIRLLEQKKENGTFLMAGMALNLSKLMKDRDGS